MNNRKQTSDLTIIAMLFATMLVLQIITTSIFSLFPILPIKPTLMHIPVIIGAIIYGPKIGMTLGGLMGLISMTQATLLQTPTSYLFSPFVEGGNINSLIIAFIPRILIGLTPYLIYKAFKGKKLGFACAGAIGSATNTIFVVGGIFFLFANVYEGNIQAMLATVLGTNAIAELIITTVVTAAITPTLLKLSKK